MAKKEIEKFTFKKHASIGATAAEDDTEFLSNCFVDTGELDTLLNCQKPHRIILGRTGTGKTALLNRLAEDKNAITINPETLSFNYLTNSNILQFFVSNNINLDLFFKLLWRHVFTVELLKKKYNIQNKVDQESFFQRFFGLFSRDKKKEKAIQYLTKFSDKFWEATEYQIKEITSKFENELKANIGAKLEIAEAGIGSNTKMSVEEKAEINVQAQKIVSDIQVRELTNILDFLNEDIFDDDKQFYYICVDKLDNEWVDTRFRLLLIRSLIDCVREFGKVRNVKIVIVLRTDLVNRVFKETRDGGFQEEKYRSLYLNIRWSSEQLKEVIERRIDYLFRNKSFKGVRISAKLLPTSVGNMAALDYMITRTLMRPRELIEFFNECLYLAEDKSRVDKDIILKAEGVYSNNRLRSLQDEWFLDFPTLIEVTKIIKNKPRQFKVGDIDLKEISEFCLNYSIKYPTKEDYLSIEARKVVEASNYNPIEFLKVVFYVFYQTGLVGLKTESFNEMQWCYIHSPTISSDTINNKTSVRVHPTFWRVLGITSQTLR